jgi:hypothetical protein
VPFALEMLFSLESGLCTIHDWYVTISVANKNLVSLLAVFKLFCVCIYITVSKIHKFFIAQIICNSSVDINVSFTVYILNIYKVNDVFRLIFAILRPSVI